MSIVKRIAFNAPYISETFNLKDSTIFGESAVLSGMEITDFGGGSLSVAAGKFIKDGIVVETTNPYAVTYSAALTATGGFLVATTVNSSGTSDTDYTISALATYSSGAIVGTYNGTEWLPAARKLQIARIADEEDSLGAIKGGVINTEWTVSGLAIAIAGPEAIFDDATYFETPTTYTTTVNSSTKHWTLQSVCAYEKDRIIDIDTFALGTVFEGTCTSSTNASLSSAIKIRTLALPGEVMVVVALTPAESGTLTVQAYTPLTTTGTCTQVYSANIATSITDFDACVVGGYVYIAYTKATGIYGAKASSTALVTSEISLDTIGSAIAKSNPKFRTDGTNLYAAWQESSGSLLRAARVSTVALSSVVIFDDVYSDAKLQPGFDVLPLRDKMIWNCLYETSPTYLIEFETNKTGTRLTANEILDSSNCYNPEIKISKWGNIYKSWVSLVSGKTVGNITSLVKTPRNPDGEEFTYTINTTDVFATTVLSEAQLHICPTDACGVMVLTIDQSTAVRTYSRLSIYGEIIYTNNTVMSSANNSQVGDLVSLTSGAGCMAVGNDSGNTYVAYIPTANATTGFTFPINGMELVRAETNLSAGIDMSYSPRSHQSYQGSWEPNSRTQSVGKITVSIPGKGTCLELTNPFGGIKEALSYLTTYAPSGVNSLACIELGPGRYPILEPLSLTTSYVEIKGNGSIIENHSLNTSSYLVGVSGKNYITLDGLTIKPTTASVTGVLLTGTCTNIYLKDNTIYGDPAVHLGVSVTNYLIDGNYCESSSGDAIRVG